MTGLAKPLSGEGFHSGGEPMRGTREVSNGKLNSSEHTLLRAIFSRIKKQESRKKRTNEIDIRHSSCFVGFFALFFFSSLLVL